MTRADLEGDLASLEARVSRELFETRREIADTRMRLADFRHQNHQDHMALYRILREEMYASRPDPL